ncbi:MAG: hypothetical protein AN485_24355, partial [Anabaena sp. MDT14b]
TRVGRCGHPAVAGGDVAQRCATRVAIDFGNQPFIGVEIQGGAGGAVGREGLADDLFDATTEGVVGVAGNLVALLVVGVVGGVGGVGHPAAVADSEKSFTHAVSVTLTLFACL